MSRTGRSLRSEAAKFVRPLAPMFEAGWWRGLWHRQRVWGLGALIFLLPISAILVIALLSWNPWLIPAALLVIPCWLLVRRRSGS
jgi:hypothetical protein